MNIIEAIETRRSIRNFKKNKIEKKILEDILKAGMYAPSAYNEQPWQFIVIDDRNLLDQISDFHDHAKMCNTAALAILICADLKNKQTEDMWLLDCAAATQNILLAAHEKDIGSVWVGVYFRHNYIEGFKKLLNLPDHIIPISLIPMGYPVEKAQKADRFKKDRIHYNSF